MSEPQSSDTYRMACKCGWKGELASSASDKCPRCSNRLRLAPSESKAIMRAAVNKACNQPAAALPQIISRTLIDKDAPKDEGSWEFKLANGVLEVIAYDDEKNEARVVRLTRRGIDILLMQSQPPEQGDE